MREYAGGEVGLEGVVVDEIVILSVTIFRVSVRD